MQAGTFLEGYVSVTNTEMEQSGIEVREVRYGRRITMTSKQRAYLKGLAMTMEPIINVGKSGVTPELVASVDEAIEKRELIKIGVLKNCMDEPKTIAETVAARTRAQVVQVIGKKIVLYRRKKENPKIELSK